MMPALDAAPILLVAAPLLLTIAAILAAPLCNLERPATRVAIALCVAGVVASYLEWRLSVTIPWTAPWHSLGFALLCLAIELFGLFDAAILYAALVRRSDRTSEADAHEARLRSMTEHDWPVVDVIIATYNEPIEVLEKTILGALALDWPNLNVWVADDGRRRWLRDWCREKGAGYITRPDNAHAKAGNINHALTVTSAPFVAILDADFVPQRQFLARTIGFFENPQIGIVQTPHHFYNHDPLQQNLALRDAMPDDQRFFFEAIMPGRDGWDASFCCGSNSVTRRVAFEAVGGGLPTGSITEDMLLTLALLRKGYITRYLNEPLAFGLAPESLAAFFVQRARWARGAIQILFLPEGPLGPGLSLKHRLFFLPTAWLSQCLMLLMALVAPLAFLFADLQPLVGVTAESAVFYLVPMIVAQIGGIVLLGNGRYHPIAAQVLGTFQSFRLLPVIVKTLVKPYGHAFQVTPKGSDVTGAGIEWGIFFTVSGLLLATMLGLVINASAEWRIVAQGALVPMVAFWCAINMVVLFLAAMLCLGVPADRAEERFDIDEPVAVRVTGSNIIHATRSIDISLSGIAVAAIGLARGDMVQVRMRGVGSLDGVVARSETHMAAIAFTGRGTPARDRLIVRLFTGGFDTKALQPPVLQAAWAMLARIWHADMATAASEKPVHVAQPEARLDRISLVVQPRERSDATRQYGKTVVL